MRSHTIGLTLIELLTTLTILSILALVSIPATDWVHSNRLKSTIRQLHSEVQLARTIAIKQQKLITVCGSIDGATCTKQWDGGELLVFHDININRELDSNDELIRRVSLPSMKIYWKGSNRRYMRARANGTLIEWGRYTVCGSKNSNTAIQLVYNRMGRAYSKPVDRALLIQQGLCQH